MRTHLAFFGLAREPFQPAPDPDFLFLSPGHEEALAQLVYGVTARKGFMLLTGDVGMGKTTLLRAMIKRLGDHTAVALVTHSALPFEGLLDCVLAAFGIAKGGESLAQRLLVLQGFLVDRHHAGQNTVVIFDDAQNLTPGALEEIRLLSNVETSSEKILQLVLAGQPELEEKLEVAELRQFSQRIALRCWVGPLSAAQTRDYIHTRLRIAGARGPVFTDNAVQRIARFTRGIPRLINNVCDHCLVTGYAEQVRRIDGTIAGEAIGYFRNRARRRRRPGRQARGRALVWVSGAGAAAAVALAAVHVDMTAIVVNLARSVRDLVMP